MWPTLTLRNLGKPDRQKKIPFESSCSCNFKIERTERLRAQLDQSFFSIITWLSVKECLKLLIILPTSIKGTPSWYCEQVQDSLALVMVMGKPTYFLTLFATPSGLTSLETSSDRPDNCACVCRAKLLHIKARIKLKDLLGEVVYFVYSIEWQKKKVR